MKAVVLSNNNNRLVLQTRAFFSFGSGSSCPKLIIYDSKHNNTELNLKCYYDISGMWEAAFCVRADTVDLGIIPERVKIVNVEMYTINDLQTLVDTAYVDPPSTLFLPLSIDKIRLTDEVKIYPNPNNGSFTLSSSYDFKGNIYVLNMLGQTVFNEEVVTERALKKSIQLNGLPAGIYFLKVQDSKGETTHRFNIIHSK
jgi:hypothetical protein